MLKDTLKNMNLFINGKGYAGVIDEITLPKLTIKTEEYRAGGMDIPIDIDMGLEKLECSFSLSKFDPELLNLFGLKPHASTQMTVRGSVLCEQTGQELPLVLSMRGFIKDMDFGSWKVAQSAGVKCTLALRYYRFTRDGEDIHEIDSENMTRKINGVDQLAQTRHNMGM